MNGARSGIGFAGGGRQQAPFRFLRRKDSHATIPAAHVPRARPGESHLAVDSRRRTEPAVSGLFLGQPPERRRRWKLAPFRAVAAAVGPFALASAFVAAERAASERAVASPDHQRAVEPSCSVAELRRAATLEQHAVAADLDSAAELSRSEPR